MSNHDVTSAVAFCRFFLLLITVHEYDGARRPVNKSGAHRRVRSMFRVKHPRLNVQLNFPVTDLIKSMRVEDYFSKNTYTHMYQCSDRQNMEAEQC